MKFLSGAPSKVIVDFKFLKEYEEKLAVKREEPHHEI